ncbi:MAG: AAA family ATPase [Sedimentisphaerales bacterium]|nr:AAA family ATPase [Sedimentisphaerales bacterium]
MICTKTTCHRLKSLSVVGGFLDGLNIDFADGLNCLIGHRGTGKTTVLEFVRYTLDGFPTGEVGQVCRRRVENLIKQNLGDGRIRLTIQTKDGLEYIVDRTTSGNPLVLTADGQPTDITINSGGIFSADIFSQNEVENIADSPESQLALIDTFVAEEMDELETSIAEVHAQLQANAKTMVPSQITLAKLADELTTLKIVEDRIEKLTDTGDENAGEMNTAQTHKALRDRECRVLEDADKLFNEYIEWLSDADGRFTSGMDGFFTDEVLEGPNGEILQTIQKRIHQAGTELDKLFRQAVAVLISARTDVDERAQELQTQHDKQELAFRDLITKFKEAQGLATERAEWERRRNDLLGKKHQHVALKAKLDKLQQDRQVLIDRLTHLRDQRFELRQSVAKRITDEISSPVRVQIAQDENRDRYVSMLADVLRHAGVNQNQVARKIAGLVAPSELVEFVRRQDAEGLQKQAALNDNQAEKVISTLADMETLLKIETVDLVDRPCIELNDGNAWKDSLSLSTGQKCTTILPILLMESENPLLVDQPEDNLDNRFIYETVVENLRRVKTGRQLILITHNPNIPVLGDAAGVFVLTSDGAKSWLLNQGDVDVCKPEIINLLEGGEEAFAQRRERYAR